MLLAEYEDYVARRIHEFILDRRPLDAVLSDIDALEAEAFEHLTNLDAATSLLELRRNLCMLRLTKTHVLKGSVALARTLLSRCQLLGFEDVEKGVVSTAIFARVCLEQGQAEAAIDELSAALSEAQSGAYPHMERLLDELRESAGRPR